MIEINKIYNESCLETLRRIPDGFVDLLLQDTPFGVTQNEWDVKPDFSVMWPEWNRVTKESGAMIFFATQPFTSELIFSNIKNFRYDLIWYKALGSGHLNANRMPMRNHEHILVFYRSLPTYNPQMGVGLRKKGKRKQDRNGTNYGKFSNTASVSTFDDMGKRFPQSVLDFSNGDRTSESEHPTQKPLDLIRYLIRTYSNEGEMVYDGYSGSGTTAAASILEGRNFLSSELDRKYYDDSVIRIRKISSQPQLKLTA